MKRSLLLPLMFLVIGLGSHTVSDRGNPIEEFNVWVHYTLIPAALLGVPMLLWYLGRAAYREDRERDEEIRLLREPLKYPPQVIIREFGFEFQGSEGRYLIFPFVVLLGRLRGQDFDLRAEIRQWRHGKSVIPFVSYSALGCKEWEESLDPTQCVFHPLRDVSRIEGLTSRACYVAFRVSEDFVENLDRPGRLSDADDYFRLLQVAVVDTIRDITVLESTWVVRRNDPDSETPAVSLLPTPPAAPPPTKTEKIGDKPGEIDG